MFIKAPVKLEIDEEDRSYEALNGKEFKDLPKSQQSTFENFIVTVTCIPSDTPRLTGMNQPFKTAFKLRPFLLFSRS